MNSLPGWTGHGWSLNVGGVITRSVKGNYDEYKHPCTNVPIPSRLNYFESPSALVDWYEDVNEFKSLLKFINYELSPDIFYFNFMGKTGRFLLGSDGEWKVDSEDNLNVIFDITDTCNYIRPYFNEFPKPLTAGTPPYTIKGSTIVDDQGNKYIFGGSTDFIEYSIPFQYSTTYEEVTPWTASAWYLNKVEDRFGNILYEFSYQRGLYLIQAYNSRYAYAHESTGIWMGGQYGDAYTVHNSEFPYSLTITLPIYLQQVTARDGLIINFHLNVNNDNTNLSPHRIYSSLYSAYPNDLYSKLRQHAGIVGNYNYPLPFFYLQSDNPSVTPFQNPTYTHSQRETDPLLAMGLKYVDFFTIWAGGTTADPCYYMLDYSTQNRLHLTGVRMYDKRSYNPSISFMGEYKFRYNHYDSIPSDYLTTMVDHWGYYNGQRYTANTPLDDTFHHTRDVNPQLTQYGMLTEIHYPTGGISTLEYEQNQYERYCNDQNQMVDSVGYAGGLRLKSISEYEDSTRTTLLSKKEYTYSNGELYALPRYFWRGWQTTGENSSDRITVTTFNVQSVIPITNSFGQHIGYSDVRETFADGNYNEYHYSNISDFKDELPVFSFANIPSPFDVKSDRSYGRGKLLSQITKDSIGNIWEIKRYKYREDNIADQYVLTTNALCHTSGWVSLDYYTGGVYKIYFPKYDIISIIDSIRYGDTFICDSITYNKNDYNMDLTLEYPHKGIMRICNDETYSRKGNKKKIIYSYPIDNTDTLLYSALACAEYYNPLISKTTYLNGRFLTEEKTKYAYYNSTQHYMPYKQMTLFSSSGDKSVTTTTFNSYYGNGLHSKYTPNGERQVSLYWNNKERLMAKVQGPSSQFVFNENATVPQSVLTNNGNNIFLSHRNATIFTYDVNNRLNSVTQGLGNTAYYNYDYFHRLSAIKDHHGYIIKNFQYTLREGEQKSHVTINTMQDSLASSSVPSIVYYDGLGRIIDTADKGINTSGKFIHERTLYDTNGRKYQTWLPFEGGSAAEYPTDYESYSWSTYNDLYPFNSYEYDPLGRIIKTTAPGETHYSNEKHQTVEYITNIENQINKFNLSETLQNGRYQISTDGYYATGTLTGEKYTDEDGKSVTTFKDFMGNTICEIRDNTVTNYIYDKRFRLAAVLPPLAATSANKDYIYEYHYDEYDRCIKKYLPGCEPTQYWYDSMNRLIYMQDGRLAAANKYRFYLYDMWSRLVVQGICSNLGCENNVSRFETSLTGGSSGPCGIGYSSAGPLISEPEIEIVNYYDNYSFFNISIFQGACQKFPLSKSSPNLATSLLTGRIVNTTLGEYIMSAYYYDEKGQLTEEREKTIDSLYVCKETQYSFTGNPLVEIETISNISAETTYSTTTHYFYDVNSGVLLSKNLQFRDGTPINIVSYTYDKAGRISGKNRGASLISDTYTYNTEGLPLLISTSADSLLFREEIHYTDGDGTPYYNGNISSIIWKTGNNTNTRNYQFSYDPLNRLTEAKYGPMPILPHPRRTPVYDEHYTYNKNSGLTKLIRKGKRNTGDFGIIDSLSYIYRNGKLYRIIENSVSLTYENSFDFKKASFNGAGYAYDPCGALIYDKYKGIASITYDYNGQPTKVEYDNGNAISYIYSALGERLKTIDEIVEESPTVTESTDWEDINPVVISTETTVNIDNFTLTFRPVKGDLYVTRYDFDEGYISARGGFVHKHTRIPYTFDFHYYCRDHLGSNRVVVNEDGEIEQVTHYYPYGGLYGDINTNSEFQPYKYGGKEFQHMHGLDLYDFHARQYNPVIGLFTSMDPLCEKYYHISPYAYCAGNPINAVDPDGKDYNLTFDEKKKTLTISAIYLTNQQSFTSAQSAVNFWNEQSGIFTYDVGKGNDKTSYIINFDLKVELKENPEKEFFGNIGKQEQTNINLYKITKHSNITNKNVNGSTSQNRINIYNVEADLTGAHEVGHSLGITHSKKGLMTPYSNDENRSKKIYPEDIYEIIYFPLINRKNKANVGRGFVYPYKYRKTAFINGKIYQK